MERQGARIVESPFDPAAEVRARSSSSLYWLERAALMLLFVAVSVILQRLLPGDPSWWVKVLPGLAMAVVWGRLDETVRIRYGRQQREEEVEAEAEVKDLAEVRAGRMHFGPVVT
ncbi:MAG: hypothetical protein EON95_07345 [Caulobacteraceae bacterium]|nr:MAG: hypothetical protein EON95_07345 [Caulobacteraceae bacterium]